MKEVIRCRDCITNRPVQLNIDGGILTAQKYVADSPANSTFVGPGLIDLQINGYAGIDFNTFPIEESGFLKVIDAQVQEGVTSFFPTIITNSSESILALLQNINVLCEQNPVIEDFVQGIHLEGPFLSPKDGARGAHARSYITAPDWDLFQRFREASNGRIKMVTISPEWNHAPAFTKKCVEEKIVVAVGHTVASPEQIRAVIDAGATMSTHLGNGAPLMLPRNANMIFEQLASDKLAASLIADGFHLPDSFLKIVMKIKQDKAILVSDSTMFAGMDPGTYDAHIGGKVVLDEHKKLSMFSNGKLLAGAAVSLLDCVNHLLQRELADLKRAWSMASLNPQRLMDEHMNSNTLEHPDLVLFEYKDGNVSPLQVIKKGKVVY